MSTDQQRLGTSTISNMFSLLTVDEDDLPTPDPVPEPKAPIRETTTRSETPPCLCDYCQLPAVECVACKTFGPSGCPREDDDDCEYDDLAVCCVCDASGVMRPWSFEIIGRYPKQDVNRVEPVRILKCYYMSRNPHIRRLRKRIASFDQREAEAEAESTHVQELMKPAEREQLTEQLDDIIEEVMDEFKVMLAQWQSGQAAPDDICLWHSVPRVPQDVRYAIDSHDLAQWRCGQAAPDDFYLRHSLPRVPREVLMARMARMLFS